MAKKTQHTVQIDVIAKGLDSLQQGIKATNKEFGDMGDYTSKLQTNMNKVRAIIMSYGQQIPTDKAEELASLLKEIAKESDKVLNKKKIKFFDPQDAQTAKALKKEIKDIEKELQAIEKKRQNADNFYNNAVSGLKNNKTVKSGDKRVNIESIKGKWQTKEDLQGIISNKEGIYDDKQIKAASAVLARYIELETKHEQLNNQLNNSQTTLNKQLGDASGKLVTLKTGTRDLTKEEIQLATQAQQFGNTQNAAVTKAVDANKKAGNSFVNLDNTIKSTNKTLGQAARALFSWTQVFNIGKRLMRATINTITEMDKALTGMMVVTGQSKEEVNGLIGSIQDLSNETSTAMTDVANLITEYVRQGRSISDSFKLAEETAKAAKIAGISTTDSIQYMTSAINGFNLEAKDATRVSDVFANIAAISATDYEQLAIALSKVSAQANLAGMSMEYTTALLAKGIETTQEAPESIGTALKTVVARMRELSDYGKTLEDGGSVNKVENALAAAGIQLRDVNGEFRNLEDIFNELGPKWDYLNTMQQQAIAQAVAGTRQQSRFIAIMQDWERTQELAAEAQDSAGASAAQYAKYAEGMEAAMTRLTTSWQSFTQALVESKTVITVVNGITGFINGAANFVEAGSPVLKWILGGMTAWIIGYTTINKLAKSLHVEHSKTLATELSILKNKQKSTELDAQKLIYEKAKDESSRKELQGIVDIYNRYRQYLDLKAKAEEYDNYAVLTKDQEAEKERVLIALEQISQGQDLEALWNKQAENETYSEIISKLQQNLDLEQQIKNKGQEMNKSLLDRRQARINELMLQRSSIDAEYQSLQLERDTTTDLKRQQEIIARLAKLDKARISNQNKLNKALAKYNKTATSTSGLFSRIGSTLSMEITSGIRSMFSALGPIGDLIGNIFSTVVAWGMETVGQIAKQKTLNVEKKKETLEEQKQNAEKTKGEVLDITDNANAKINEELEEEQTEEEREQTAEKTTQSVIDNTNNATALANVATEKAQTREEKNQTGLKLTNTGIDMAGSAAKIPMVGWVIAGAILLALGIGTFAGIRHVKSDSYKENKIKDSQNDMYEKKRQNKDLESNAKELEELLDKDKLTIEEEERLRELEGTIQDLDETLKNKTGEDLLEGMKELQEKNEKLIKKEIESNYQLALSMKDLANSDLGQQAIEDKVNLLQDEYIEYHESLMFATDDLKNAIEKQSAALADSFAENVAYQDAFKYKEKEKGETAEERQARKEHNASIDDRLAKYTEDFAKTSVDFVTDMEAFLSETDAQGKELHNFGEQVHEYMKNVDLYFGDDEFAKQLLAEEYEGLAFITDLVDQETELGYKNSVLENIDKLTELGILTTDNIKELANMAYHFVEPKDDTTAQDLYKDVIDTTTWTNKEAYGIQSLESNLGIDLDTSTIDDMVSAYDNFLNSGEYKSKKTQWSIAVGGVAPVFGVTEDELNDFFNLLKNAASNGYGNLTVSDLQNKKIENETTPAEAFNALFEELLKIDGTNRVQGIYEKMLDSEFYKDMQEYEEIMNTAYKNMASATTKEKHDEYMAEYKKYRQLYEASSKLFDDTLKSMTNYMSADQMYEVIEKAGDAAKNVVDIREAALAGEGFSIEQLQKLENDIIPTLQAEIENFDASKFIEGLEQGTAESIAQLEQYQQFSAENTKRILQDNIQSHLAEIKRLEDSLKNVSDESEKRSITASIENEKLLLSIAEQTSREYERQLDAIKGMNKEERERYNRQNLLTRFENTHNMDELNIDEWKEYADLLDTIATESTTDLAKALRELAKDTSTVKNPIDVKALMSIMKFEGGVVTLTEAYDDLDEEQKQTIDNALENIEELVAEAYEASKQIEETYEEFLEDQFEKAQEYYDNLIDAQNRLIDYYKNKLQEEQEELQKSLDKRKEMYEKYYDSLEEQESDEDFEEQQAKLQRAIASLAAASDGTSLAKSKELQKQLEELEEEQLSAERERRRENVMATLDNESEIVDEYYDNLLEDNRRLWEDIKRMDALQIHELMTTYNEEWKNGTDEQRKIIDMENMEIYKQFPELANLSKEEIEAKYEAMKKQFIEDAGFSTTQITDKINKIELDFITMLDNILAKLEDADKNDDNDNSSGTNPDSTPDGTPEDPIIIEPSKEPLSPRAAAGGVFSQRGDHQIILPYSTGGYVDYTGLAMVHGSQTKPEAFLNTSQTAMFADLATTLEAIYSRPSNYADEYDGSSEVTIENLTIAVDAELTNDNIPEIGQSLADALFDGIRRSGYNINTKK